MSHKKFGPDRFSRFDVYTHDVHKENMFTINLEDGREAPSKASHIEMLCNNVKLN